MTTTPKLDIGLDDDTPPPATPASTAPRSARRKVDMTTGSETRERLGFDRSVGPASDDEPLDGRSLRATGRTVQMNIKVTPEAKRRYLLLVKKLGATSLGQLVERGLELVAAESEKRK